MNSSFIQRVVRNRWLVLSALALAGLTGCMSKKPTTTPKAAQPAVPVLRKVVTILSDPIGLTVVVNGVPVGKTPYELEVETTPKGFFAKELTVKVRFLAMQSGQVSRTIEEVLLPVERVPVSLMFTTEGVGRATP